MCLHLAKPSWVQAFTFYEKHNFHHAVKLSLPYYKNYLKEYILSIGQNDNLRIVLSWHAIKLLMSHVVVYIFIVL